MKEWGAEASHHTVFPLDDNRTLYVMKLDTLKMLAEPVTLTPFRPPLERYREYLQYWRPLIVPARATG